MNELFSACPNCSAEVVRATHAVTGKKATLTLDPKGKYVIIFKYRNHVLFMRGTQTARYAIHHCKGVK